MRPGVVVTGGAGFIGSHVVDNLLDRGERVAVLDDFNHYYDPDWKRLNVSGAMSHPRFHLIEGDIRNPSTVRRAIEAVKADRVVHLAARAGVQPSLREPVLYTDVNVTGTQVVLDVCAVLGVAQVVTASSSSVYGSSQRTPFRESDDATAPVSPYAATKRANELQCYVFHHHTGTPVTCLRFFTAYGPRNRPDMAVYGFAKAISEGREIRLHGAGTMRDFTYVGDVARGVVAALDRPQGMLVCNLGRGEPVQVDDLVTELERLVCRSARVRRIPLPPGDVPATWADITVAKRDLGWEPRTSIREGLESFFEWYQASQEVPRRASAG